MTNSENLTPERITERTSFGHLTEQSVVMKVLTPKGWKLQEVQKMYSFVKPGTLSSVYVPGYPPPAGRRKIKPGAFIKTRKVQEVAV
jgi:hypothetical protein